MLRGPKRLVCGHGSSTSTSDVQAKRNMLWRGFCVLLGGFLS